MGFMPYPWEKGFLPTAVEEWFNEDLDTAGANQTPQDILLLTGPKRRLRAIWRYADVCRQLRMGEGHFNSIAVVTPENSIIKSGLFDWAEVGNFDWRSVIARDWFGMELVDKVWYRQNPETWPSGKSIGHWNGYAGNVELIVCETLQRMLELSLGVDHLVLTQAPGNPQQLENDLRTRAKRVWPVYMFLTCPNPWFESWVTWQCHSATAPLRGQVTVVLTTPSHDRPVTPSPLDVEHDEPQLTDPTGFRTPNPYYLHGRDTTEAHNHGYRGDYITFGPTQPRVAGNFTRHLDSPIKDEGGVRVAPARNYHQGVWLVTHANHDSTIVWNNFPEPKSASWNQPDVESWDLPPFAVYRCAAYEERRDLGGTSSPTPPLTGSYDVVVVQPASLDGGVW